MIGKRFTFILTAIILIAVSSTAAPRRVACVGDSITFGSGLDNAAKESYPAQLGELLGDEWEVRNFGVSARTLLKKGDYPYWEEKAFQEVLAFQPQDIIILLGTNDSKPQNWQYQDEYSKNYRELIQLFKALPSVPRIWLGCPPPVFKDQWGITNKVVAGEVVPKVKTLAQELELPIIDFYTAMQGRDELFFDGIHPNKAGATFMAQTVYRVLKHTRAFPGKRSEWNGYDRYDFQLNGRACTVVTPATIAGGKPWIWRARFFGHEPQTDLSLLSRGFHLVYMDVAGLFGSPTAVAHWNQFYAFLTEQYGLAPKAALEGMSRGGLIIYNWAAANPDKVACIYADAPVCDFKSWPGGKGTGKGSPPDWERCKQVYGLSEAAALAYDKNPIDQLKPLAEAKIPLLHVCGAADEVVPVSENTAILEERYQALGGKIQVILKEGVGLNTLYLCFVP